MNMNPYAQPFMNPFGFQQPTPQPVRQVEKVNGRNGAMQYPLGPNGSAWILDECGEISWLIQADSAGYKTVTPYDVTVHRDKQEVQYESLENRLTRLEEIINGWNTTDSTTTGKGKHTADDRAGSANDEYGPYITESTGYAEPARHEQPAPETGAGSHAAIRR